MSDEDLTAKNDSPNYDDVELDKEFAALVAQMQSGVFAPNVTNRMYWLVMTHVTAVPTQALNNDDMTVKASQGVLLGGLYSSEANAKAAALSIKDGLRETNPTYTMQIDTTIVELPLDVIPRDGMFEATDISDSDL